MTDNLHLFTTAELHMMLLRHKERRVVLQASYLKLVRAEILRRIERHESYHGRTTPEVTWRVWNTDHTYFTEFKRKVDALQYAGVNNAL